MFAASVTNVLPMIVRNFRGICDGQGDSTVSIAIPNVPALKGITLYTAFVNHGGSSLLNISNDHQVTIQ